MMRAASILVAFAVLLMSVGNISADEKKPQPEGRPLHHPRMERGDMIVPMEMLKKLDLSEEQKAKLEALKKEYGPKFKECREKAACVLTEEQRQARQEAVKEREEAWKAMKLTDEQKAKMAEVRKEDQTLRKEVREKVMEILTPEQKAQLKKEREHHREHMKPK